MISVIILTLNESADIAACLESLRWCDDVHVVDSGSDDGTREIAAALGARVSVHDFESFGEQRNWAIVHCGVVHEWILFVDADERVTDAMVMAMKSGIQNAAEEVAGFYCCWKLMLGDRWLKRSDNFPKWQFRLLKRGRARFTDFGHGQKEGEIEGDLVYIHEPYLHFAFSRGWEDWMQRHRKYARQEARARASGTWKVKQLFSPHASIRNPAIKSLMSWLPGWPTFRFIFTYIIGGGFFEGREGLEYCLRMRWFERQVQQEMRLRNQGLNREEHRGKWRN